MTTDTMPRVIAKGLYFEKKRSIFNFIQKYDQGTEISIFEINKFISNSMDLALKGRSLFHSIFESFWKRLLLQPKILMKSIV